MAAGHLNPPTPEGLGRARLLGKLSLANIFSKFSFSRAGGCGRGGVPTRQILLGFSWPWRVGPHFGPSRAFTGDAIRCSICSRSQHPSFRKVTGAFKGSATRCSICSRSRPSVFTTARGNLSLKCTRLSGCSCISGEVPARLSEPGRATSIAYTAADRTSRESSIIFSKRGMLTATAYTAADCKSRGITG